MQKLLYLYKIKSKSQDKGFITLEIVVSIFIAAAFLAVSLQTLVLATMFSVGAREDQRADKWIQEKVEELNDLGGTMAFPNDATTVNACNGNLDIDGTAGADEGFAQGLWNLLTEGDVMTPASSATDTEDIPHFGTTLTVTGTQTPVPEDSPTPHRILGINYVVTDDNDNEIANRYVEIIPDAALRCS